MKRFRRIVAYGLIALLLSGCSILSRSSQPQSAKGLKQVLSIADASEGSTGNGDAKLIIANPPAKTIRFDGSEIVLGTADTAQRDTDDFCAELSQLLGQQRHFSASQLIYRHPSIAEHALWERYVNANADPVVPFIADILSREVAFEFSWNDLLFDINTQVVDGELYHLVRSDFVSRLTSEPLSDQITEQLKTIAQRSVHPLVMFDALRLIALRELVAERHAEAEAIFLQTAEIAEQHGDAVRAAESWLMVAIAANRAEHSIKAADAWRSSVNHLLLAQSKSHRPLNTDLWMRVEQQRPNNVSWPKEIAMTLKPMCLSAGCELTNESPTELALWTAIAISQYENDQPQLALVNLKKAEAFAVDINVKWLRIAQSKCLASLGQSQAAAALLSEHAASENKAIASAAMAALGSAKLQAGAYQQATQLISKALTDSTGNDWPTRDQAEADLALALLIIGDTDQGLSALHAIQAKFQLQGDRRSLLQSLGNEQRILELEGRTEAVKDLKIRITQIENI